MHRTPQLRAPVRVDQQRRACGAAPLYANPSATQRRVVNVPTSNRTRCFSPSRIAVGLAALTLVVPATSWAASSPKEDPALQALAAKYYAEKYGVSSGEATRRLEIQDKAANLSKKLGARLAGDYAGVWFSPESDKPVKIGVEAPTSSDAAKEARAAASADGVAAKTDVVTVSSSFGNLETAQKTLDERLGSLIPDGKARSAIDPTVNSLIVETARGLTEDESDRVQEAMNAAATSGSDRVAVRRRATEIASLLVSPNACDLPYCDRGLRGGVRINQVSTGGYCTHGFNSRSRSNPSDQYVLTAGHCPDRTGEVWDSATTSGRRFNLGSVFNRQEAGDGDAAIIRNNGFWNDITLPGPYVVVDSSSSTTLDTAYEIDSEATSSVGRIVCQTSATPYSGGADGVYTQCGTVDAVNQTVTYSNGTRLTGMVKTDRCGVGGSSGGPYYKDGGAYGIHSGSRSTPPCQSFYTPATKAEDLMRVDILHR